MILIAVHPYIYSTCMCIRVYTSDVTEHMVHHVYIKPGSALDKSCTYSLLTTIAAVQGSLHGFSDPTIPRQFHS